MSKKAKIGILVALGMALVVLLYFISPIEDTNQKEENKKEYLNKELRKQKLNKDGVYILYELLKRSPQVVSMEEINDSLESSLVIEPDTLPLVYFLIDRELEVSEQAVNSLLQFVRTGNHAFVSISDFENNLGLEFSSTNIVSSYTTKELFLENTHDTLLLWEPYQLQKYKNNNPTFFKWNYFEIENLRKLPDDVVTLSYETNFQEPVFIKFPFGKGYFYLHSIPQAFYNESMFSIEGYEYAERTLSNLPKGHYKWHNHLNQWDVDKEIEPGSNDSMERQSPIQYILKERSLRSAYLLLVGALLVYVLFKLKRKQNIIPTIEPNNNSSLEFLETVSKLYLRQNKHSKFIKHYEHSFIHFIKDKYFVSSPEINSRYINQVAIKSEIESDKIQEIFDEFVRAKGSCSYTSDELIALHKKIEYFYKNCK